MGAFLDRLRVEAPVVQAGMGGGLAGHELAAAVSSAGGLGTIGILPPDALRSEIARARRATGNPLAVNLLLPFARRAHFEAPPRRTSSSPSGAGPNGGRPRSGSISAARSRRRSPPRRPAPTR